MAYRIFISATRHERSERLITTVRTALYQINEFPVTALATNDIEQRDDDSRLDAIQRIIQNSDILIGLYGYGYGDIPPGETRSYAELEYHIAHQNNLMCLIFVPEAGRDSPPDERLAAFLEHLQQHHIINTFSDSDDLRAKVLLALDNYRQMARYTDKTIRPPAQSLRAQTAPPAESEQADTDFETLVERALTVASDDIEQIIRRALDLHQAQQMVRQSSDHDGEMRVNPIFGPPLQQDQFQSDIFMIMPFREQFNSIYENVVRPVVASLNLTIKRGDDFTSLSGAIMNEVWAALNACRLVIVETTEVNANVYYELGIAHTLGKPAILLTQAKDVEDLPFDIRHLRFIVYDNTIPGGEKLEADLQRAILWILNDLEEQASGESGA